MQTLTNIPLADLGDVLKNLAPIIFVVLYGVAHLVGNIQQEKRKAAAPRPKPVIPPQDPVGGGARNAAPGNPAAGNQPTLEETLRREVEEFLRRAQGGQPQQPKAQPPRPQQRPQQRPAARGPARQPARTPEQSPQPPRRLVDTQRPEPAAQPVTLTLAESRQPMAPPSFGSSVTAHVQGVAQHAQSLGADIAQTDERMQEHLRQKFVHQVGAIAPTTSVQRQATGTPAAAELRAMLARPGGARQLIIASEILRRPEERWD
jgi:hypothetical protein